MAISASNLERGSRCCTCKLTTIQRRRDGFLLEQFQMAEEAGFALRQSYMGRLAAHLQKRVSRCPAEQRFTLQQGQFLEAILT
mmetsp:Transcript_67023/g.195986  ORF Transcript_67023/g.195986 Transcript_67023/m.195986 type:complete len:83 (+) Transcript_67023:1190-1438(+)